MSVPSSWAILIAQDDGTDIEFRNVGFYTSGAGEIPKRTQTAFWTRRKSKNYQSLFFYYDQQMHNYFTINYSPTL